MPKPKISMERVTGVVALSYLVLIPVAGYIIWQKVCVIDQDVTALWTQVGMDEPQQAIAPVISLSRIKEVLGRR